MSGDFDIKTAKVKDCPCRKHLHESVRNYGTIRWIGCVWPDGHMERSHYQQDVGCQHKWNKPLKECKWYSEWAEKQVKDAFKKLEETEAHRDAVLAVLRM